MLLQSCQSLEKLVGASVSGGAYACCCFLCMEQTAPGFVVPTSSSAGNSNGRTYGTKNVCAGREETQFCFCVAMVQDTTDGRVGTLICC